MSSTSHESQSAPMFREELGESLFLHWEVDPASVRPLVSPQVELDLYEGLAFVGMIFRRMESVRPFGVEGASPFASFCEVYLRTYVRRGRDQGLWLLSVDTGNELVGRVGRSWMKLPFFHARVDGLTSRGERCGWMRSERLSEPGRGARAEVHYALGSRAGVASLGSLERFLHERDRIFSEHEGALFQTRIQHEPYLLIEASVLSVDETLSFAAQLALPSSKPVLAHGVARGVLDLWPVSPV